MISVKTKAIIFILFITIQLFSCTFKKEMTVRIKNHNNFPITITLKTNNISKTFDNIKPQEQLTDMYDWTNISKTEGSFLVFIENEISHGKDSFQHGQYFNGELGNYMDLKFNGEQYKIVVTD